jgi:UDP-2-acetamido-2,6-beta-L-arabino-hexul-4-ose reductase
MSKKSVGVTGQQGFIGKALFNSLGLLPNEFERVPFDRDFFEDQVKLEKFVIECDVIVHLAAMNRHHDPKVIYETNISLVQKLLNALERSNSKAHVLFSSSSQEESDNLYARSKKEGRELLSNWASKSEALFTGMIIPNVFGPFGNPYFNSFIATFSHQLTHGEQPKIDVDGHVKLIHVTELVNIFIQEIRSKLGNALLNIPHSSEHKVSEILRILERYKVQYFESGIIPELNNPFEVNLFNTFRSYIDHKNHFPVKYLNNTDSRGSFAEIIRMNVGGQVSFSTTVPGITRGNHFHTRKIERFSVIKGKALIQLRRIGTNEVHDFYIDGDESAYVDMPIWYTHSIKNIGEEMLYTVFWINEAFDANNPDTYFEIV